jgi:hypothetical protein
MMIFVVMKKRRIEDDASRFAIVVVIVIGEGSVQCPEERCVCFCLFVCLNSLSLCVSVCVGKNGFWKKKI